MRTWVLGVLVLLFMMGCGKEDNNHKMDTSNSDANISVIEKKSPRIIGGYETGSRSWMVALIDTSGNSNYEGQFCGGVLIDSKWILTAAHCLYDDEEMTIKKKSSNIKVLFDTDNLTSGGTLVGIKRYIIHPDFLNSFFAQFDSDMALLELDNSVSNKPIKLISNSYDLIGEYAIAMGWGLTNSFDRSSRPEKLHQVWLPIASNQYCKNTYGSFSITSNMLCAGYEIGYRAISYGDSGGPLITTDNNSSDWKLAGISSFKYRYDDTYVVFTKVSNFKNWISSYVKQDSGSKTTFSTGHYNNNAYIQKRLEIKNASCLNVSVKGESEKNYDFITIYNSYGNEIKKLSGTIDTNFEIYDDAIDILFTSDFLVTKSGVTVNISQCSLYTNVDYYGSLAISSSGSDYYAGYSWLNSSKTEAETTALEACKNNGTSGCYILTTVKNQCISFAIVPGEAKGWWARYDDLDTAKETALRSCNSVYNNRCSLWINFCADGTQ